eukprot:scaffold152536_cov30-Tisochrysis_lutea.AAC.9
MSIHRSPHDARRSATLRGNTLGHALAAYQMGFMGEVAWIPPRRQVVAGTTARTHTGSTWTQRGRRHGVKPHPAGQPARASAQRSQPGRHRTLCPCLPFLNIPHARRARSGGRHQRVNARVLGEVQPPAHGFERAKGEGEQSARASASG